jgi:signal peptidase I
MSKSISRVLWAIPITLVLLKLFVFQQVIVVGSSMSPNFENGEMLIMNQLDKNFQRGQVVAAYEDKKIAQNANFFTRFNTDTTFFLKRVIGLPGESIEIFGGQVIIYNNQYPNGAKLIEDYISNDKKSVENSRKFYLPKTQIPVGNYFLMGDNRPVSKDSRYKEVGFFPSYSIFGQETIRILPTDRITVGEVPKYTFEAVDEKFITEQRAFFE